jgi:hypothetical protein
MASADAGVAGQMKAVAGPACVPLIEQCDGQDNDCDMRVDEDVAPMACGVDRGICKQGTIQCRNGKWDDPMTQCQGAVWPEPSEVCDAARLDENCDGMPNEGCTCNEGESKECGQGPYTCMKGTVTCRSGQWSACEGEVRGTEEVCDGTDNDCDRVTDNNPERLCGADAVCKAASGCQPCGSGFSKQGNQCVDDDECRTSNPCDRNADCINTAGSYQ